MEYVKRIAQSEDRKQAIEEILIEMGAKFSVQSFEETENLVLSFGAGGKRLVIGAHWDVEDGSCGGNDNASGCAVLLHTIKALLSQKELQNRVDFVFFGAEELGGIGATRYIEFVGRENIAAMVNFDMCGYGDTILINDKGNRASPLFGGLMAESLLKQHKVLLPGFLPEGDDYIFALQEIPSISVCVADQAAAEFFAAFGKKLAAEEPVTEEDQAAFVSLGVVKTMHGGELDDIAYISSEAIEMTATYLFDGLME